jgi:site-specific recombinase XerD
MDDRLAPGSAPDGGELTRWHEGPTGGACALLPFDRNPVAIYLAGLAPTGRRSMLSKLRQVALVLGHRDPFGVPWHQLRFQHLSAVRTRLQEAGLAPATVNGSLHAVRGVLRAAHDLGLLPADEYQRLRDVRPVRGERLPAGRALAAEEVAALVGACVGDRTPVGPRDAALVGLLYGCGLRRAEVVALDVTDYSPRSGELVVRGKGNRERLLYVTGGAAGALTHWLELRGGTPGPLFTPLTRGGAVVLRRLSDQAVYNALRKRAQAAGLKALSPHDLRRTFVSDLLDAGADMVTVQRLAGHANVQTTARYDRRGEEAKRRAAGLLRIPYPRPPVPPGRDTS